MTPSQIIDTTTGAVVTSPNTLWRTAAAQAATSAGQVLGGMLEKTGDVDPGENSCQAAWIPAR